MIFLKNEKGQILIIAAVIFSLLVSFLCLALSASFITHERADMQNALDLSVLAGAEELRNNPGNVVSTIKKFGELNGLDKNNISVTLNYLGDSTKVFATAEKNVKIPFIDLLGKETKKIIVSSAAQAKSVAAPAFDYAIFSGSHTERFAMPGSRNIIDGKVQANYIVKMSGKDNIFNDNFKIVGAIDAHPVNTFKSLQTSAPVITMPIFDIQELKKKATKTYNNNVSFSNVELNGVIYVNGNVGISGGKVKGKGSIVATGDISIAASRLQYETIDDTILFYSLQDISISGSDIIVEGSFYAPNGNIAIPGSRNIFKGSIIADTLAISGSDNHFIYDPRIKSNTPGGGSITSLIE